MPSKRLTTTVIAIFGCLALYQFAHTAEPAPQADRWAGTFFKYARYDRDRQGQFGEAQEITIAKEGNGYRLNKPFHDSLFVEVEKGILSDGNGFGKIYLGTAEFADGKRVRLLRADFCYEDFVLYDAIEPKVENAIKK